MEQRELDCKNLNCPMPIVRISQAIKQLSSGDRLIVEASDPAFKADLEAWIRKTGNSLLSFEGSKVYKAIIEKA